MCCSDSDEPRFIEAIETAIANKEVQRFSAFTRVRIAASFYGHTACLLLFFPLCLRGGALFVTLGKLIRVAT
mgnify:CR=1 FL=1